MVTERETVTGSSHASLRCGDVTPDVNLAPAPTIAPEVGYARVDAQPDVGRLVEGMDATARWQAVIDLRSWERERLNP